MASASSILITGAEGFVGAYLIRELAVLGTSVYGTYFIPEARHLDVLPEDHWFYCDLNDREAVFSLVRDLRPTFVYHLAGISFVPMAESNRPRALATNVGGTLNLLEALADLETTPRMVLISSGEVYGKVSEERGPMREDFPLKPANFYAATKAASEKIAWPFFERGEVALAILRPFNHIGPGQSPTFVVSDFARQVARITLGQAEPVVHVGDIDVFRDFTDVRDIVRGYRLCYEKFSPGGIFNIASGRVVAIRKILETLISFSDKSIEVVRDPERFRKAEVRKLQVDISRFKEATGWSTKIPIEQTLRDVYENWLQKLSKEPS